MLPVGKGLDDRRRLQVALGCALAWPVMSKGGGLGRLGSMNLHADLHQPVVLNTATLAWIPSPMAGVERRLLDRIGGEVARATSLVRYASGSRFAPHSHGGGEEILVLQGVFSDEQGDHSSGTYLRNPVGTSHAPYSAEGCTILVKQQQMHPADQQRVVCQTSTAPWLPGLVAGLEVMPLHGFGSEHVALVRWAAGTVFQPHSHPGGEEILVLDGVFQDEHGTYQAGCWLRNPPGSVHHPWSEAGCTLWVKTGHLPATIAPDGSTA
jgi:anti-sigma factor ChrR (cupin superfamily)